MSATILTAAFGLFLALTLIAWRRYLWVAERSQDEVTIYGTRQSYRIDDRQKLFLSADRQGWLALDKLPGYPNTTEVFIDTVRSYPASLSECEESLHGEDGLVATRVIEAAVESAKIDGAVIIQ